MRFSPDGRRIAAVSSLDGRGELVVSSYDYDADVPGLRALSRYQFEVRIAKSDPRFLHYFADHSLVGAMAREVVESYSAAEVMAHPVGTGPFKLGAWRRSSQVVLERNPSYREVFYDEHAAADDPAGEWTHDAVAARFPDPDAEAKKKGEGYAGTPECKVSSADYPADWVGPYMGFDHVEIVTEGHNNWLPMKPPHGKHYERWYYADGNGDEKNRLYETRLDPQTTADQTWHSALPPAWHNSTWIGDRTIEYLRANKDNKAVFESKRAELEAANTKRRGEAEVVAKKMDGLKLIIVRQAGEGGQVGDCVHFDVAFNAAESQAFTKDVVFDFVDAAYRFHLAILHANRVVEHRAQIRNRGL